MNNLKIDARINAIAKAVGKCNTVIDIGTDHGKLPAKLLIDGVCSKAILVDISKDSLQKAKDLFDELKLDGKFIVSDGFEKINEQFDCVVISGMGSELISDILQKGVEKLNGAYLVLGPNLKEENLRKFLGSIHYCVQYEILVRAAKRIYCIMYAQASKETLNPKELYIGKIFNQHNDIKIIREYLDKQKKLLQAELYGKNLAKIKNYERVSEINTKLKWIEEELEKIK